MEFIPCRNSRRNEELLQLMVGYRFLEVLPVVTIYSLTIQKMQNLLLLARLEAIKFDYNIHSGPDDLSWFVFCGGLFFIIFFFIFYFLFFIFASDEFSSSFAHSFPNVFFILTPKVLGEKPNITKTIDKRNKQNKKSFLENVLWCFHFTKNKP